MTQPIDKFVALNKKHAETAFQAFQIGFDAWESLVKLNLEAGKSLVQESIDSIQGLSQVRDASALSAWAGGQVKGGVDRISGYSRNVYEIGGPSAGKFGILLEQSLLSTSQDVFEWVDEALKASSIPQPEGTAAAAKAAMANAKAVIEGISKAVRETAGYADANVRAAAAATAEAVKKTTR